MNNKISLHRKRNKALGTPELIAIALGGMVGGGIFTVLGVSVALVGVFTPIAIIIGGGVAFMAAYSYVKLGVYYKDEGATYSFYKKTFPQSAFAASLIGWWVIFGYISTLALYAYTFSSYLLSASIFSESEWLRKGVAMAVIALFVIVNVWSVKGMGKLEDLMVYSKLVILVVISFVLINNGQVSLPDLLQESQQQNILSIFIVASITFVAYEGFQLVINAVKEMPSPEENIPKAIYSALFIAVLVYSLIAVGALMAIPFEAIIENKEYALASGAERSLGHWGTHLIVIGALLATSSAISGTLFGASRQMAVIANDGYFPAMLGKRMRGIPVYAIIGMGLCASVLVIVGELQVILEFGSITFLLVSLLMAYANFKRRKETQSSVYLTITAMLVLAFSTILIFYYEWVNQPGQVIFIGLLYAVLTFSSWLYARVRYE